MLNVLYFLMAFAEEPSNTMANIFFVVRIVLAVLILACAGFITFVVMKQSGNSDGMEAFMGSSSSDDDNESYYGKNAGARSEAKLKKWTYICAGILAICCILFVIFGV